MQRIASTTSAQASPSSWCGSASRWSFRQSITTGRSRHSWAWWLCSPSWPFRLWPRCYGRSASRARHLDQLARVSA